MPTLESTSATEILLTRQEKERLLQQMYSLPHWIAIIRLFGYQAMPMDQARREIKPIAEEHGKEPVANACEALVEISMQEKEPFARLKTHIRRMAFQILGPESTPGIDIPPVNVPEPGDQQPATSTQPGEKKRRKKPATSSAPPQPAPTNRSSSDGPSAIMQQYRAAKEKHPDMVLLFRMGDFYEVFDSDADICHRLLGLTLTTRDREIKMAGFPHHQLEQYLHKLLKEGQRVAVCEPTDDSVVKGPIKREVTRVVTPGSMVEETKPIKQPRHFVLKKFEERMNLEGLAYVAIDDVKKTTPAVVSHVAGLDFIVLRGEEKLLVTVRPHLQAKHLTAIRELQDLFGAEYKPMRIWPSESPDGWKWDEHAVDDSAVNAS